MLPELPDLVLAAIRRHQPSGTPPILVACSGGVDSQVLLHSAAAVWPAGALFVAHVHHGLQPEADDWLRFCEAGAARLGASFLSRRLPPLPDKLESGVEGWARRLRYQALADMAAQAGAAVVLTAHHANDQLETHQLRRLRGAGALGLGAMRGEAPLPGARERLLVRPFLDVDRQRILEFARRHRLDWVDDPSNQDLRYARNRIRREFAQTLRQDPASLQRGLAAIGEFQVLADAARRQARRDLAACRLMLVPAGDRWGKRLAAANDSGASLSRASLARLPPEHAAEALRLWLQELGCRMPSRARLAEIVRQLLVAKSTHARLQHDGIWLLRYRDRIDAMAELPAPLAPTWFRWSGEPLLNVAGQQFLFHRLSLEADLSQPPGIDAQWLTGRDLMMDKARGSDRLRVEPGGHRRTWKNLSQERGVPPWLRAALPVLRLGDEVLYAAPFGMNREVAGRGPSPANSTSAVNSTSAAPAGRVAIEWLAPPQWSRWL